MKRPTVRQTHAICDSLNARAVIVLAFSADGMIAGASYGETRLECSQIGYTLDRIIEAIEDCQIPVWATERSESTPGSALGSTLGAFDAEMEQRLIDDPEGTRAWIEGKLRR